MLFDIISINRHLQVSLEDQASKPSNTEELKGMLKYAGTELTVKYLTGNIFFI